MSEPMLDRRMVARSLAYFVTLTALGVAAPAAAQQMSSPSCGTENLLAGRIPVGSGVRGNLALVTDGQVGPEGATWDAPVTIQFDLQSGSLTWDLGRVTPVSAFASRATRTTCTRSSAPRTARRAASRSWPRSTTS
jgi:hypothetical protein